LDKKIPAFDLMALLGVCLIIFILSTQILGVPLWWVFRGIVRLSIIRIEDEFKLTVSPESASVGDSVLVTVRNATDNSLVENAKISLYKNGDHIYDYYTDSRGQVEVEYVGEVTIIEVSKTGFKTEMQAIPESPTSWMNRELWSFISAVISGSVVAVFTHILQRRRKKTK